ncbi:hypothetical protein [Effusibacillus lacus]|nr:hypothetical protein [Effusibacillus lacus]
MSVNYTDPFSVWKSFYSEVEPKISQSLQKVLESEEYAAAAGQMLNATLQLEHLYSRQMEKLLQNYKLPTTKDIARLCELVIGLESKIDQIEERLIRLEQSIQTGDMGKQIALLSQQLSALIGSLQSIEKIGTTEETPTRGRRQPRTTRNVKEADESTQE